jgi:hypothetical protein
MAGSAQGDQDIVVRALGKEHPGRRRGAGPLSSNRNRMTVRRETGVNSSTASSWPIPAQDLVQVTSRLDTMMEMMMCQFNEQK